MATGRVQLLGDLRPDSADPGQVVGPGDIVAVPWVVRHSHLLVLLPLEPGGLGYC